MMHCGSGVRRWRQRAGGGCCGDNSPKMLLCVRVNRVPHFHPCHRSRKCNETRFPIQSKLKCGQITVPNNDLWISLDRRIIDKPKDARRSVSAPHGNNCPDGLIPHHFIEIVGPVLIASGKVSILIHDMGAYPDPVSQLLEIADTFFDLFAGGRRTGWRNKANGVSLTETRRFENGTRHGKGQEKIRRNEGKSRNGFCRSMSGSPNALTFLTDLDILAARPFDQKRAHPRFEILSDTI